MINSKNEKNLVKIVYFTQIKMQFCLRELVATNFHIFIHFYDTSSTFQYITSVVKNGNYTLVW